MEGTSGNLVADLEARDQRTRLERAIAGLPVADQRVVRLRFGMDGLQLTLREVGWLLRLSSERVRQIEARALRRLRRAGRTSGIADYGAAAEEA